MRLCVTEAMSLPFFRPVPPSHAYSTCKYCTSTKSQSNARRVLLGDDEAGIPALVQLVEGLVQPTPILS